MSSSERARLLVSALAVLVGIASAGCVEHALREKLTEKPDEPIPVPELAPPSEGGIWRGETASGSFLFFDRKARGPGDLVTVLVVEKMSAQGSANTKLEKDSQLGASATSDVGFTGFLQKLYTGFFGFLGVSNPGTNVPAGQSLNVLAADTSSSFEGDGETSREGEFNAVLTCRVLEVLPGGVLRLRGRREIVVNHELQILTLEGLVRREDVGINNTVLSTALADARLTYDGIGVVDDKQRPPLVARLFDWLYPF